VLELSVDRVRQPKQYSLELTAEGEQGRHVPDMTRQRIQIFEFRYIIIAVKYEAKMICGMICSR